MNSLEAIFSELGISQYLNVFVDQGFDSWETILDITESDLDALGVKLGHRRKLQRRIANSRGLGPDVSLVSPTRTTDEDGKPDVVRPGRSSHEVKEAGTVTKRKYRRHPKPDENAPERPPSAYVLFSNKMREDLKGRNLTFTEIAKLVGENWQSLSRSEKEPFETQAHDAKDRYNRDLSEYKKTPDYRKYNEYLQDFRKRQAAQASEKDASKRLKTESDGLRGASVSTNGLSGSNPGSGTGSGSESQPGSEPPPSRHQRIGSSASEYPSLPTGIFSNGSTDDTAMSPNSLPAFDDSHRGRPRGLSSPNHRDPPVLQHPPRRSPWNENSRMSIDSTNARQPWILQHSDSRGSLPVPPSNSPDGNLPSLTPSHSSSQDRILPGGHRSRSSASAAASRPPPLIKEQSSGGSMSSHGSNSIPRTPSDASLPIHALLSSKPEPAYGSQVPPLSGLQPSQTPLPPPMQQPLPSMASGDPTVHGHSANATIVTSPPNRTLSPGLAKQTGFEDAMDLSSSGPPSNQGGAGLDGISALLKAREIVDRRPS